MLFQLGSPLRRRVSSALIALRENGTYQQIYEKWLVANRKNRLRLTQRAGTAGRREKAHQRIVVFLCTAFCLLLTASVRAQEPTPAPSSTITPQDLAKSVHNPFEDFVKIPVEETTGFGVGPSHHAGESVNLQPVFPFRLSDRWDLIVQPSQSVTFVPSPDEQFGFNDLQASFYLTPSGVNRWIWGLGPIFEFPTATGKQLGTGRWSAGPVGALIYSDGPWFNGVLASHLMSFAGDRKRGSVNQTSIEPEVSYNLENGWYGQIDPTISYDGTADMKDAWILPIGADIGKAFSIGPQALSLQLGSYDFLKYPEGGPQWIVRVQFTLLFPTGR